MGAQSMFKASNNSEAMQVSLLLIPNFSMLAFTSFIEPMRLANQLAGKSLYDWHIVTRDGNPVVASNGIEITPHRTVTDLDRPANVVVCSGVDAHIYQDALTFGWLRRWAREGSYIGALCTGAHILAHAGLLNGYRCTIHWANLDSFVEEFPDIEVRAELYELDRDRFTCAGGIAPLDMMLNEITRAHDADMASSVSEQFMHERIREGNDDQRLPLQARLRVSHPKLIKAISEMEKNTEEALRSFQKFFTLRGSVAKG